MIFVEENLAFILDASTVQMAGFYRVKKEKTQQQKKFSFLFSLQILHEIEVSRFITEL